jgi:hypothetical protein
MDDEIPDGVFVAYWAALDLTEIEHASKAYGKFQNRGIARKQHGKCVLRMKSPMAYRVEDEIFRPHVHFTTLIDDTWNFTQSYTVTFTPLFKTNEPFGPDINVIRTKTLDADALRAAYKQLDDFNPNTDITVVVGPPKPLLFRKTMMIIAIVCLLLFVILTIRWKPESSCRGASCSMTVPHHLKKSPVG